jgi:hypothetical protein
MAANAANAPDVILNAVANAVDVAEAAAAAAAEAQRDLMIASLGAFGYNAATRAAVVTSLNLLKPLDLYTIADNSYDNLAGLLLRRHTYRANAAANAINIPLTVADDLRVYKMWVSGRFWQGLPLTADLFNAGAAAEARSRIEELRIISMAAPVDVRPPSKFKDMESFVEFKQDFDHACSRLRGVCGVPISWTYRAHVEVTVEMLEAAYATKDAYYMATMRLEGPHYDTDNKTVFDLLMVATQENPSAWAYVKSFKATSDGRGAVLALALYCGGRATQQARSKKAHVNLAAAIWDGRPRRNFTFENFNAKFKDAFDELEQLNEPIPGHVQVTMYIKSIQDPKLEAGLGNILASDRMLNSFEDASAFMANYHLQRSGVANNWGQRTVSDTGRKRGPEPFVPDPDRPHIHDGSYDDADWNDLTEDEQNEVKQLHKEKAKASKAKTKKAKANKAKQRADDDDEEQQAD